MNMCRIKTDTLNKLIVCMGVACIGLFLFIPAISFAQGLGGFAFDEFSADIEVKEDGRMEVTEKIKGEFFENRHGIFRQIPVVYQADNGFTKSIRVDVADVLLNDQPVPYSVYRDGDYQVVQIGDPNERIIGPFVYTLRYSVQRAILFGDTRDELYWNVTGNNWAETIPSAKAVVRIPSVEKDEIVLRCYTGYYGSVEEDCESVIEDGEVRVYAPDFLTIAIGFPKGIIQEPTTSEQMIWWFQDNWDVLSFLIPILTLFFLLHRWWHHGRDPKGRGTIIAEYEPPGDLRPTEVGTLIDTKVHARDFSAGIVDLAVRGYIRIHEQESKRLAFARKTYSFEKLKEGGGELRAFERKILEALFPKGETISTLKDRSSALAKARKEVAKQIYQDLAIKGLYVKNPNVVRSTYFGIAIGVGVIGHIVGVNFAKLTDRPFIFVAAYATADIIALYAPFMPKKTHKGVKMLEQAQGFREFLRTAEKYRLKWQEEKGIFEKYLPYAMVFGVADKWAKAFEGIQKENPSWYVGSTMAQFNPTEFSHNLSTFVDTSAKVVAPSSGGGYSGGGGFSGGGFGGGGGGSW